MNWNLSFNSQLLATIISMKIFILSFNFIYKKKKIYSLFKYFNGYFLRKYINHIKYYSF